MSTRAARGGQRPPTQASSSGGGAGGSRKPQQEKPDPVAIVRDLKDIVEPFGYSEADLHALVKRCNYDRDQINVAIAHLYEDRQGHEHSEWSTTDTASEKKDKVALAKERKAQRQKEEAEEAEREKQRKLKVQEEEKKRHLEMAARRQAMAENLKNKPGSALVQRAAPWTPATQGAANTETNKESVEVPSNGYDQDDEPGMAGDYAGQDECLADDSSALEAAPLTQASENWSPPAYDAIQSADAQTADFSTVQPAMQLINPPAASGQMYAPPANSYVMSAPPGVSLPDQAATWSSQSMGGWDGSGAAAAASSQTAPWSSPWPAESPAWSANAPMPEQPPSAAMQQQVNGKDQWSSGSALPPASSPTAPSIVPLMNDTVTMPQSFWDLIGNGPIPQVMFGSLHVQSTAAVEPQGQTGGADEDMHDDEQGQQDEGRSARRDRTQGGGKKGGGGRRVKGGFAPKGDAGGEGTGDDGKGRPPRKGSARGGSGERGGPGGGGGKGKGWRGEKGDREKGDRQKGKAQSQ